MSLTLRELMRPMLTEFSDPFFTRGVGGMLIPAMGNLARNMARRPAAFSVRETDKEVIVEGETPGYTRDNLSVNLEGGRLVIKGAEQKGSEESDFFEREEFTQAFELPEELRGSKVNASYKDGILRVTMEKPEKIQPKKVQIAIEEGATSVGQQRETIEVQGKDAPAQ